MIDTAERRRSVIDFGKGQRGTGMPIPSGSVGVEERTHLMNLYPGITPVTDFFFFWRRRTTTGNTGFLGRLIPSSTWGKASDADEDIFVERETTRDS